MRRGRTMYLPIRAATLVAVGVAKAMVVVTTPALAISPDGTLA
jgi:hypothetical protein